jgi:hypothetical protein
MASAHSGSMGGSPNAAEAERQLERAERLEVSLADVRGRIAALEEDVLALQFAADAPEEVADLPVRFQNSALQASGWLAGGNMRLVLRGDAAVKVL